MVRPRQATNTAAAQRQAQAGLGQAACLRLAQARLADDRLARGCLRAIDLARFARVRVCAARGGKLRSQEWLLIEWPKGSQEPAKYWLSTLPENIAFERLVDLAKLRWRIERDYQELKQELGLGHFEGRGWRGFHHHATLCIAAYGFLISERETIPPSAPRAAARLAKLELPADYRPRGAANPNRASHS